MEKSSIKDKIIFLIVPLMAHIIIRFIGLTMRKTYINSEKIFEYNKEGKQMMVCFWHDQMILSPYCYRGKKVFIMASKHKDGLLTGVAMKYFSHLDYVLGSTTRGWMGGVKAMLRVAKQNNDLALTPDGPKGPRHEAKLGAIGIAKLTGMPIFPVAFMAKRKKIFNSWDKFMLPYPFNRAVFVYGDPITVERRATDAEMEEARLKLQDSLNELTNKAEEYFL